MKQNDARKLIVTLLVFVVFFIWWTAISLHGVETAERGPSISSTSIRQSTNSTASVPRKIFRNGPNRPLFVLHVGPPKTATTSIQCGLDRLSQQLALQDSYYFVGKRCPNSNGTMANGEASIPGHHLMMGLINANPHSRGFEKLSERMDYHQSRGNHIILSLEAMANHLENRPETWDLFLSLLEGWNVRIVVTYRHYFEWIQSLYFQQHIGKKYRLFWPDQRGLVHPSFQTFLSQHLDRWEKGQPSNDQHSWGQHLTLYALQYFSQHFQDVQIFDLHQPGDVVTNFICQMIPGATHTCRQLREIPFLELTVKRESHSFDPHRLAMAAYQQSILHNKVSRTTAVDMITEYLNKTNDLSDPNNLSCLPDALQAQFLNASLWFEQRITMFKPKSDSANSSFHRDASDHRRLFEQAIQRNKFCEVNVDHVLQLEQWRNFLAKLKPKGLIAS